MHRSPSTFATRGAPSTTGKGEQQKRAKHKTTIKSSEIEIKKFCAMSTEKPQEFNAELLQDMLPIYYKRLFPHKLFYRWLSYNLCKFHVSVLAPKPNFVYF